MAGQVYSTRFLQVTTPGTWLGYTVPAGYRAVVRSIAAACNVSAGGQAYCSVNGVAVFSHTFTGPQQWQAEDLRAVAYATELVQGYVSASNISVAVSGYLFLEGVSLADEPPLAEETPPPAWWVS